MKYLHIIVLSLFGLASAHASPIVKTAKKSVAPLSQKLAQNRPDKQGKINLNQADARTLAKVIKGVGAKRAEAIVLYREQHGHFTQLAELAKVKGISKRFIEKNQAQLSKHLTVG